MNLQEKRDILTQNPQLSRHIVDLGRRIGGLDWYLKCRNIPVSVAKILSAWQELRDETLEVIHNQTIAPEEPKGEEPDTTGTAKDTELLAAVITLEENIENLEEIVETREISVSTLPLWRDFQRIREGIFEHVQRKEEEPKQPANPGEEKRHLRRIK